MRRTFGRQDEAVSQRTLIPYEEYITARRSIYNRTWTIQPRQLFPWGLKQLGLLGWSTGAGHLPAASFVIIRSVEVCLQLREHWSFTHLSNIGSRE